MAYPTGVSFKHTSGIVGAQPIHETSTTARHALGTVVRAKDVTYGEGEFVYLLGVASTAQGDLCFYNSKTGATVRSVANGTGSNGPAGVVMSDNVTSQYGWYQVTGSTPVKAATVAADTALYLTATAGQVDDLAVTANLVDGILAKAATVSGYATCQLNRPNVTGLGGSTGTNTGDITLGAIGSSANANSATLTAQVLNLEPASASFGGIVTTGTQSMAGAKTFTTSVTAASAQITTPASGTGITLDSHGLLVQGLLKVTLAKEAWVAANTTQDITLAVIAARTRVRFVYVDTTVAYAGLAGTIALTVGTSAGGVGLVASHDVKSAAIVAGDADAELGASITRAAAIQGAYVPSWSGATTISIRLTSGTGNIGSGSATNLSTGATTIYLGFEVL